MASERKELVMRNPIAKSLRSPHLFQKVVKPLKGKGSYDRKKTDD